MDDAPRPLVWIDVVGLTPRLLAHAPNLRALGGAGSAGALGGVLPGLTCPAQATALTGLAPSGHGIVANGWFHRETGEVRFWLQSHALLQGESLLAAARARATARGLPFTAAHLFWWFNQGSPADVALTPKPHYGADGSKAFAIHGHPAEVVARSEREHGRFPFASFWGPAAGLPSSEWIARVAADVIRRERPVFTLVYLPHLDYDLQRFGPNGERTPERVAEVDRAAAVVIEAARERGAEVVAFSEYGLLPVSRHETPNRALRAAGLLEVREGPFGETLDVFRSRAFAVCDHQVAHVYVRDPSDLERVGSLLDGLAGTARVLDREAKVAFGLEHPRSGDLVLLARPDAWFAYPYWLDDRRAPDFARTVDIHRKPGYDPLELLFDPRLRFPRLRVARRLLARRLGMRALMDVVPLDPSWIRGSHGLVPLDPLEGPVLVADDPGATERVRTLADLKAHALERMGLA